MTPLQPWHKLERRLRQAHQGRIGRSAICDARVASIRAPYKLPLTGQTLHGLGAIRPPGLMMHCLIIREALRIVQHIITTYHTLLFVTTHDNNK